MNRYVQDSAIEKRYTQMEMKKIIGLLSAIGSIMVALFTWGNSVSEELARKDSEIKHINKTMDEAKTDIRYVQLQNSEINNKLTDMLHKQDKRIDLLEHLVTDGQLKQEK